MLVRGSGIKPEQETDRKDSIMRTKKNVEAIVSAMGALLAIVVDLVAYIREFKGEVGECIYQLAQPEGKQTLNAIAKLIVDNWQEAKNIVKISLADLVAMGNYDWVNSDIKEENFPIDEPVNPDEETKLFYFDREMSSEEVVVEMDKKGWKPAKIWHLLFFGAKNPKLQKQFPIIALGSVWRGLVPYLRWGGIFRKRDLRLSRFDSRWGGHCRFLAVRK